MKVCHEVDRILQEGRVFVKSTGLLSERESVQMPEIDEELVALPSG